MLNLNRHKTETRNEKITQMIPANGWWKAEVWQDDDEGNSSVYYLPIAFFATIEFEEREIIVVDKGSYRVIVDWHTQNWVYANTGHDDWQTEYYISLVGKCDESRLFYDPDFRAPLDMQGITQEWIERRKKKIKDENEARTQKAG